MEIRILFEDEQIIVCEKPAGVAVQTKRLGQADMESLLKNRRAGKGELPYIGVVHRLDQPVSGVMVFAKTKEAAAALSRQIASGLADKFYYAVTDGVPETGKGQFTDYLLRDGRTNTSAVVESSTPGAKRAELSYEVLEQKNGAPFFGFIWEPADIIRSACSWHMQGCRLWETGSTILKRI